LRKLKKNTRSWKPNSRPKVLNDRAQFKAVSRIQRNPEQNQTGTTGKAEQSIAENEKMIAESTTRTLRPWLKRAAVAGRPKNKSREELIEALLPQDPMDKKNCIIEIRAGAGGDEASLFAAELFRMYARFAEKKSFKTSCEHQPDWHRRL